MEKTCKECGLTKPIECFYKHSQTSIGYMGKCKECTKASVKAYRAKNIERVRAYDRSRTTPERLQRNRENIHKNKEAVAKYKAEWAERNRHKRNAQQKLSRAVAKGLIVKPTECSSCRSAVRLEAHHPDYSMPLHVLWLCDSCHKRIHKEEREAKRLAPPSPAPLLTESSNSPLTL